MQQANWGKVTKLTSKEEQLFDSSLCAIELEESILGGILLDPLALTRVNDILVDADAFYMAAHQEIYRAMLALSEASRSTDLVNIALWLNDRNRLDKVGGKKKLLALLESTVGTAAIDQYAEVVQEKYKRRKLRQVAGDLLALASDNDRTIDQILDVAEQKLFSLSEGTTKGGLRDLGDYLLEELNRIESVQQGGAPVGTATMFYDLDVMLQGGPKPGQLIIIGGRPGQGKTAFVSNIAVNIASQGVPVALFSLEMDGGAVGRRMLASESRIDSGRLGAARISDQEWSPLDHAYARLSQLPIKIDDNQSVSLSSVRSQCRRMKAQQGLGLVIVDYLHLMIDGSDNEVRELGQITRQFKKLARELQCPVVVLSQLSRALESRTNKRPIMSDIRQSGSIEQDADIILFLYRDEYYNPDTPNRGIAEIIVGKQREGPTGTVELLFESQFTQFRNLAKRY